MLKKLDYKKNRHILIIEGNFRDSKDSFFYVSQEEVWHITFVKVEGQVEEWIRKLILLDGLDEFFVSEVEFKYSSEYKTMGGARGYVAKQLDYFHYKEIINEHIKSRNNNSRFRMKRGFNFDGNTPF